MTKLNQKEIDSYKNQLKKLSNSAEYEKAFKLAKQLTKKYPTVLIFAYYEAVMIAEDDLNFSPKQIEQRFKLAANKIRILLRRTRSETPQFRLAKNYALKGKKALSLRWAKKSEKAWLGFHKINPKWSNSYIFLGMTLGYQDRLKESDLALEKWRKLTGKPKNWSDVKKVKEEIRSVHSCLYKKDSSS